MQKVLLSLILFSLFTIGTSLNIHAQTRIPECSNLPLPQSILDQARALMPACNRSPASSGPVCVNPSYISTSLNPNFLVPSGQTLKIIYLSTEASYYNEMGYFVYDSGTSSILGSTNVLFPNSRDTALSTGTSRIIGPFSSAQNIGFYLSQNGGYPDISLRPTPPIIFYSLDNLNPDNDRYIASVNIPSTSINVLGFEDVNIRDRDVPGDPLSDYRSDGDYNDFLFTARICLNSNNTCDLTQFESDPDCECSADQTRSCGISVGQCRPGVQTLSCVNGRYARNSDGSMAWGACGGPGYVGPSTETCDGIDNNCNGQVDEGTLSDGLHTTGERCSSGLGTCRREGSYVCAMNSSITAGSPYEIRCDALEGSPSDEICDGLDNNCNGQVDESNVCQIQTCRDTQMGRACTQGIGACQRSGTFTCNSTGQAICDATAGTPVAEICNNGIDDDCNGRIDDDETCQPIDPQQVTTNGTRLQGETPFCNLNTHHQAAPFSSFLFSISLFILVTLRLIVFPHERS